MKTDTNRGTLSVLKVVRGKMVVVGAGDAERTAKSVWLLEYFKLHLHSSMKLK